MTKPHTGGPTDGDLVRRLGLRRRHRNSGDDHRRPCMATGLGLGIGLGARGLSGRDCRRHGDGVGGVAGAPGIAGHNAQGRPLLLVQAGQLPLLLAGESADVREAPRLRGRGGRVRAHRGAGRVPALGLASFGDAAQIPSTPHADVLHHFFDGAPSASKIAARSRCDLVFSPQEFRLGHVVLRRRLPEAMTLPDALREILVDLFELQISKLVDLGVNDLASRCDLLVRAPQNFRRKHLVVCLVIGGLDEIHPRVLQCRLGCHPLLRIRLEEPPQEVRAVLAELRPRAPLDRLRQDLDHDVPRLLGVIGVLPIL
mmetsp:Transcript_22304/g.63819  ORF Transcript_22304/g.63819 Transcript_22304/m.63819 type:complete len:313 (+) Transcript_22304:139-1077(+)